jgi:hypothetical protein
MPEQSICNNLFVSEELKLVVVDVKINKPVFEFLKKVNPLECSKCTYIHVNAILCHVVQFLHERHHSLVPFLAKNYSKITVVDLRYINGTFEDVEVNVEDYDSALFMYNVITFSQDVNVKKLSFM